MHPDNYIYLSVELGEGMNTEPDSDGTVPFINGMINSYVPKLVNTI
jgi:hypothetical protein